MARGIFQAPKEVEQWGAGDCNPVLQDTEKAEVDSGWSWFSHGEQPAGHPGMPWPRQE